MYKVDQLALSESFFISFQVDISARSTGIKSWLTYHNGKIHQNRVFQNYNSSSTSQVMEKAQAPSYFLFSELP